MTYTRHGHHINGTPMESGEMPTKARCGGPAICSECALDQANVIAQMFGRDPVLDLSNPPPAVPTTHNTDLDCPPWCPKCREEEEAMKKEKQEAEYWEPTHETFPDKARQLVFSHIKKRLEVTDAHVTFGLDGVYVVFFTYTLGHWKALVSTTLPDGMYYEVTHNSIKHETYIDSYKKWENTVVPD